MEPKNDQAALGLGLAIIIGFSVVVGITCGLLGAAAAILFR